MTKSVDSYPEAAYIKHKQEKLKTSAGWGSLEVGYGASARATR